MIDNKQMIDNDRQMIGRQMKDRWIDRQTNILQLKNETTQFKKINFEEQVCQRKFRFSTRSQPDFQAHQSEGK